jgi:hypothetical protein
MKKIILFYGLIAGTIVGSMLLITMPLYEKGQLNWENGQLLGYSTMVIALAQVFFGIKSYRDHDAQGKISFGKGLQIGVLITLVASLVYASAWEVSYRTMSDSYIEKMSQMYFDKLKEKGAKPEELTAAKAQFDLYQNNVIIRFLISAFMEMFPVGLIISLISAGLLRKKEFLPSAA